MTIQLAQNTLGNTVTAYQARCCYQQGCRVWEYTQIDLLTDEGKWSLVEDGIILDNGVYACQEDKPQEANRVI